MSKKTKTKKQPFHNVLVGFSLLSVIAGLFFAIQKNAWPPTLSLSDATLYNDILIRAKGSTGNEMIELRINGEVVKTIKLTKQKRSYVFRPQKEMSLDTVEVFFTNDLYDPINKIDYNAHIDFIKVNGKKYETEHPTTRSKGSWVRSTRCAQEISPQSETLHCNGYMRYNVPKDTIIGQQRSDITIADITVEPTESEAKFTFKASEKVQAFVLYGTQDLSDRGPHEKSFTYDKHVQTLRNLAPNTTYKYRIRVNNKEGVFAIHNGTFTTEGGPGEPPVCGNEVTELGEQCDDGNTTNGDGCSRTCQVEPGEPPVCGNGKIEVGEQCDDGNETANDGCYRCSIEVVRPPVCGNEVTELGEQCDDGNTTNGDGCSRTCQVEPGEPPVCGNGKIEVGEQCDDGNETANDGCYRCSIEVVRPPVCGNEVTELGEQCDDGNTRNGDGCSNVCQKEDVLDISLTNSSFFDGNNVEVVRDVAIDEQGNTYFTGGTQSSNYHVTSGAYDRNHNGNMDVFVTKVNPQGRIVWSTYLGGSNYDRAYAIELDRSGNVYVAGRAGAGFPTTGAAAQKSFNGDNRVNSAYGSQDGFVSKISSDGSTLLWSTYVGGEGRGFVRDIDVSGSGKVFIALSSVSKFPSGVISANAVQPTVSGLGTGLVVLSSNGSNFDYGTYLGGGSASFYSQNPSIRVDSAGATYILYSESSSNAPTTRNAFQTRYAGSGDIAIAKFDQRMSLVYGTYVGGSGVEGVETHNLAVDKQGRAIISFGTNSQNLPTSSNAHTKRLPSSGAWAGFIGVLSANGSNMEYGTYYGGNGNTSIEGISVLSDGRIAFSGPTKASNLPTTKDAVQSSRKGSRDGFMGVFSPDLSTLEYSSYFGSSGDDQIRTSMTNSSGQWVVAGHAQTPSGFTFRNAFTRSANGNDPTSFKMHAGFYGLMNLR